jgi:hypothetical protein
VSPDVTGTCANCVYAHPNEQHNDTVFCRRYAPRPDHKPGWGLWPMVNEWDWCGEFKNRKWKRPPDGM